MQGSKKVFGYLFLLILIALSCQTKRINQAEEKLILQIGDYKLYEKEFFNRIEKIKSIRAYGMIGDKKAMDEAWDISLKIGYLLAKGSQQGLDSVVVKDKRFNRELTEIMKTYAQALPDSLLNSIPNKIIKQAWKRRNRTVTICHLKAQNSDREILEEIIEKLEDGRTLRDGLPGQSFKNFEINQYSVTGGDVLPEIENQIWDLGVNELKIIKTRSGYHLIQIIGITQRGRELLKDVENEIRRNIARAKLEDQGCLHQYEISEKEVWIDRDNLKYFSDMPDTTNNAELDRIVIETNQGRKIRTQEIKNAILDLTTEEQKFFLNSPERIKSTLNLVLRLPDCKETYEKMIFESLMVDEFIRQKALSKIKITGSEILSVADEFELTLSNALEHVFQNTIRCQLQEIFRAYATDFNENILREAYLEKIDDSDNVQKKFRYYKQLDGISRWTNAISPMILNSFTFIDTLLIQNMALEVPNDAVVAAYNGHVLLLGELKQDLNRFSQKVLKQTRESVTRRKMAVFHAFQKKFRLHENFNIEDLKYDNRTIDMLFETGSFNSTKEAAQLPDSQIIATYGEQQLSVAELKKVFHTWDNRQRSRFIQNKYDTLLDYLIERILVSKFKTSVYAKEHTYLQELKRLKEKYILEYLYQANVASYSFEFEDDYLRELMSELIASENEVKLNQFLDMTRNEFSISVNMDFIKKMGIPVPETGKLLSIQM